jgi:transcriptional regulator with XRE-family HTH domain
MIEGMKENLYQIGKRLKKRRKEKGLTIKILSEYTGLSVGYLSNLENDVNSPTIDNLSKICEALNCKLSDIIIDETPGKTVIRKTDWRINEYPQYNQEVGVIDFKRESQQIYEVITIKPGKVEAEPGWRHMFSETCTVIQGMLTVKMEGTVFHLEQWDSIYVPEHVKHSISNETDEICVTYWVCQRK